MCVFAVLLQGPRFAWETASTRGARQFLSLSRHACTAVPGHGHACYCVALTPVVLRQRSSSKRWNFLKIRVIIFAAACSPFNFLYAVDCEIFCEYIFPVFLPRFSCGGIGLHSWRRLSWTKATHAFLGGFVYINPERCSSANAWKNYVCRRTCIDTSCCPCCCRCRRLYIDNRRERHPRGHRLNQVIFKDHVRVHVTPFFLSNKSSTVAHVSVFATAVTVYI